MPKALQKNQLLSRKIFSPTSPLWTRAPTRSQDGKAYSDFMLLIPGLKNASEMVIESKVLKIQQCLQPFEEVVVYIDLNLKLNLLWVSIKPVPGMCKKIIFALQDVIPEARVVASDMPPKPKSKKPWLLRLGQSFQPGKLIKRLW